MIKLDFFLPYKRKRRKDVAHKKHVTMTKPIMNPISNSTSDVHISVGKSYDERIIETFL